MNPDSHSHTRTHPRYTYTLPRHPPTWSSVCVCVCVCVCVRVNAAMLLRMHAGLRVAMQPTSNFPVLLLKVHSSHHTEPLSLPVSIIQINNNATRCPRHHFPTSRPQHAIYFQNWTRFQEPAGRTGGRCAGGEESRTEPRCTILNVGH